MGTGNRNNKQIRTSQHTGFRIKKSGIYLLLILLFSSVLVHGQKFEGGIGGGLSASQVDGDTYSGFNKIGIIAGGWVSHNIFSNIDGQLELMFVGKGAYETNNKISPPIYYNLRLRFIDLPILLNFSYRKNVVFNLGMEPEYLVYHQLKDANGPIQDVGQPYNNLSMSAVAGVGYKLFDKFIFNVRYSYSVFPIRPHAFNQTWFFNRGLYNNCLTVMLFYRISLQH